MKEIKICLSDILEEEGYFNESIILLNFALN